MREKVSWALPGIVFVSAFTLSAACGSDPAADPSVDCPTDTQSVANNGVASKAASPKVTHIPYAGEAVDGQNPGNPHEAPLPDGVEEVDGEAKAAPSAKEINTRLHGCKKLRYETLGAILAGRGVALSNQAPDVYNAAFGGNGGPCEMAVTAAAGSSAAQDPQCPSNMMCYCPPDQPGKTPFRGCIDVGNNVGDAPNGFCVAKPQTAGFLYFSADDAFSVPKPDSRLGEKEGHTTASALRIMDIFVQAAPQIIANIGNPAMAPACTVNGQNYPMFDPGDNSCVEESVSCLIGQPATEDHMLLCNLIVSKAKPGDAEDLDKKKRIAVAALLSAAHSCE